MHQFIAVGLYCPKDQDHVKSETECGGMLGVPRRWYVHCGREYQVEGGISAREQDMHVVCVHGDT